MAALKKNYFKISNHLGNLFDNNVTQMEKTCKPKEDCQMFTTATDAILFH